MKKFKMKSTKWCFVVQLPVHVGIVNVDGTERKTSEEPQNKKNNKKNEINTTNEYIYVCFLCLNSIKNRNIKLQQITIT